MKILYYIRRFWEIPFRSKKLLAVSLLLSIYYSFIFHFLPLKYYSNFFKENNCGNILNKKELSFSIIRQSIYRTSLIVPWKLNCVVKSLVFSHISRLLDVPTSIAIEVIKNSSNDINLHAYVLYENKAIYLNKENNLGNTLLI